MKSYNYVGDLYKIYSVQYHDIPPEDIATFFVALSLCVFLPTMKLNNRLNPQPIYNIRWNEFIAIFVGPNEELKYKLFHDFLSVQYPLTNSPED